MTLKEILEFNFINVGDFHLSLYHFIAVFLIIMLARVLVNILGRLLTRYFNRKEVDSGRQFAFLQFIKYIVYTAAILMAFDNIGIELSVIWGGAAALMVGIGLGLQQTFNDIVSGLILLMEGTVEVGDVIELDDKVGIITDIGIRTSKMDTRDKISVIIPNSKLVGDNATNWSHNRHPTRFKVNVGVAYSSDINLVTDLLLQAVQGHEHILKEPKPVVQFLDFGNSSLDFCVYFHSSDFMRIELVKSQIRYKIMELFRANNVEIPFPQRDLWLRNAVEIGQQKTQE